jgi:hypothetical protein
LQKIGYILLIAIFATGCSVVKNRNRNSNTLALNISEESVLKYTVNQNLTNKGFFIEKAEISIFTSEGKEKVLGSVKFEYPDKYLVSIKSKTGIEAARIFISKDTILINDRINKILYFGSPDYLRKKYGIPASSIPVIFGDFSGYKGPELTQSDCLDGKLLTSCIFSGVKINYVIDCKRGKSISATTENGLNKNRISISFNDFVKIDSINTPGRIEIEDSHNKSKIEIKIIKIDSPWTGSLEFIPGSKYEHLPLL